MIHLSKISEVLRREGLGSIEVRKLNTGEIKELQEVLKYLGYEIGEIDGIYGERSREGYERWKEERGYGEKGRIGEGSIGVMRREIEERERKEKGEWDKERVVREIIRRSREKGLGMREQIAYILATVEWETNRTFKGVKEAYWLSEDWRRRNLRYYPYYGRGFVQITWRTNYEKYSRITGIDLVNKPDEALRPEVAIEILMDGVKRGGFTGVNLEMYINRRKVDYYNARRVINGTDKAAEISEIAIRWEKDLEGYLGNV